MNQLLDSNILLTMISINMTIIGLTSLAERKTIIGVDYGKYLINHFKLFRIVPMYVLLIAFAVVNVLALFTLYLTDLDLRLTIFIGLTICLSFAIYYFFGFIIRENRSVKAQIIENEFIGLYYADDTPPGAECDRIVGMNNGFRTTKRVSTDVVAYFNHFNNDTQQAFAECFGPQSFIYRRNYRIKRRYWELTRHRPYDYSGTDGLMHISWEFFQLYRWSELQEKWIMEILVLFNDRYAKNSPEMRLNNLLRVLFHINVFGRTENMFGYRVMDYISSYVQDAFVCKCEYSESRKEKEQVLLRYYCQYMFSCIQYHYAEQSFNLVVRILKDLLAVTGAKEHIDKDDMMQIILAQSAKHNNIHVEQIVTKLYNFYCESSTESPNHITLSRAKQIVEQHRQEDSEGAISRNDIFS